MSPVTLSLRATRPGEFGQTTIELSSGGGAGDLTIRGSTLAHLLSPGDKLLNKGRRVIFRIEGSQPQELELSRVGHIYPSSTGLQLT